MVKPEFEYLTKHIHLSSVTYWMTYLQCAQRSAKTLADWLQFLCLRQKKTNQIILFCIWIYIYKNVLMMFLLKRYIYVVLLYICCSTIGLAMVDCEVENYLSCFSKMNAAWARNKLGINYRTGFWESRHIKFCW